MAKRSKPAPSNLEPLTSIRLNLPETAERVETRVTRRRQTTGYLSTRDGSRRHPGRFFASNFSPRRFSAARMVPRQSAFRAEGFGFHADKERPVQEPNLPRWSARAKHSPLLSRIRGAANRYTDRLETRASHTKQRLGPSSNRYRSCAQLCLESLRQFEAADRTSNFRSGHFTLKILDAPKPCARSWYYSGARSERHGGEWRAE